ncbi:PepSY domain-containing protein [Micromonospora sp. WMMD812]|uniref:PepSY-associated TM helix domain-containing protein n=1 Tax=Micromonospora sp. WMMD812 TaxID=3015152 RepID=UPI00248B1A6B|nr:PepSY domain-containing protein [Micromonospora sp. WMMD812]WBB67835.1 PepSY domain-containing protein [Micromonospora sp. WMMD812]
MTATTDRRPAPASPPSASAAAATAWGGLLLRIHFYAGILVAPFLVVAALTGLAYTVTPQVDRVIYGEQLLVDEVGGPTRPLAEQVAAARSAHPDGTLATVAPGDGDTTTRVVFDVPGLGEKQHTVFVDPFTAQVKGTLTTWFGSTPVTTWLDDLHRNLHLGVVGRHYSELAASWLWVLVLGGIVLWWRRQRPGVGRLRRLFGPDLTARRGVRRTRGWHAATGLWLAVGLLVLSATGLTWSRYAGENFGAGLDALNSRSPELSAVLPGAAATSTGTGHHGGFPTAAGDATPVDPALTDPVLAIARDAGLHGPVEITPPADAQSAWTVTQVDNVWPVRKDRVAVDPATSTVTARSDFASWPLLAQLSSLGVQAHMGLLFGPVNQILLAALAVGLLCVIVWGYRMWWQRRPTRTDRRAFVGTAPARGAWQRLPGWGIALGVPAVFAIGWALPLFGVTVLAFLALDLAIGAWTARRGKAGDVSVASSVPGR